MDSDCTSGRQAIQFDTASQNKILFLRDMKKVMPFLLIVFGFLTLDMFQGMIAMTCMVIGITMLLERIWPEHWEKEEVK